jgi:mRNA interferase MazF
VKRGDVLTVAAPGAYTGKPRPAVVVQSNAFNPTHGSVTLCLVTSDLQNAPLFRIPVEPNDSNGLTQASQVMIDKLVTVPRDRLRDRLGTLDPATLEQIDRALLTWLGLKH